MAKRYQKHKDSILVKTNKYKFENKDKIRLASQKYYIANRERILLATKLYQKLNKDMANSWYSAYRARKRKALIVQPTREQLAAKLSMFSSCYICKVGQIEAWDHVKPLAKGGSHCLSNLKPICKSCNSSKIDIWKGPVWAFNLGTNTTTEVR